MIEYMNDGSISLIPSGLIFPTSYLLFWAVYYSYYCPGFFEERLTAPKKWDMMAVPTILIGVTIWFVKVTVVELGHFLFSALLEPRNKANHSVSTRGLRASQPRKFAEPQVHGAPAGRATRGRFFIRPARAICAGASSNVPSRRG